MPRSGHIAEVRELLGDRLLLVPSVAAFVFDPDGRVLLLRHTDGGRWAPPGGAMEPDETPADAVVRECREELGVEVEPRALLGVFGGPGHETRYDNGDRTAYVITAFECAIRSGELEPDGVEVDRARFASKAEVADLDVPAWVHQALPLILQQRAAGRREAVFVPPRPGGGREDE